MNKQELLNCAADYIEKNGKSDRCYFKSYTMDPNLQTRLIEGCPACVVGAAITCIPEAKKLFEEYETFGAVVQVEKIFGYSSAEMSRVYQYSDTHTQEQVVAWLREGMPL